MYQYKIINNSYLIKLWLVYLKPKAFFANIVRFPDNCIYPKVNPGKFC